jgi:hypothetical protein
MSLTELNLNSPALMEPTEEQLRKALAEAVRSRSLLENEDFQWWVSKLEEGKDKHYKKLVYSDEEPAKYNKRRGMIQAIERGLEELRLRASQVESLEGRIRDRQEQPVARGA